MIDFSDSEYYPHKRTELVLFASRSTHDDIGSLVEFLNQHPEITELEIVRCSIADDAAKILATTNKTIRTLSMRDCQMGDEGAIALAASPTITTLSLPYNNIGPEGAKALAANKILTGLFLPDNQIGDDGAKALATNDTLINLDLSRNEIGDDGAMAFATNYTLNILYLDNNGIGMAGALALAASLNPIHQLIINENPMGSAGERMLETADPIKRTNIVIAHGEPAPIPSLKRIALYQAQALDRKGQIPLKKLALLPPALRHALLNSRP